MTTILLKVLDKAFPGMILKVNDSIELVPISLEYEREIHHSFNQEIIEFLPIEEIPHDIRDTRAFIERSIRQRDSGTDLVWVILYKKQFSGCCGIHTIQSKTPHFGIWIKSDQQGKGIGKQVVHYVLHWGITSLDIDYIKYPVDRRNTRSLKLIANLNLKLSDHYQLGEEKKLDINEYRIYKENT